MTNPTQEQIGALAERIVNNMSSDDLQNYVYEDMVHIMGEDSELYEFHLANYGK